MVIQINLGYRKSITSCWFWIEIATCSLDSLFTVIKIIKLLVWLLLLLEFINLCTLNCFFLIRVSISLCLLRFYFKGVSFYLWWLLKWNNSGCWRWYIVKYIVASWSLNLVNCTHRWIYFSGFQFVTVQWGLIIFMISMFKVTVLVPIITEISYILSLLRPIDLMYFIITKWLSRVYSV